MGLLRADVQRSLVIATGQTASAVYDAQGFAIFGIVIPTLFTGTSISFTVCDTRAGTYQVLYDNIGTAVALTVAAGRSLDLPTALAAWPFWRVVSNAAETPARTLVICAKG